VHNRRSLVFLDNLVDAVLRSLEDPRAVNQTFLVSDGEDVSTGELVRRIARALGRSARLVPVPPSLLRLAGAITGHSADVARLLDDFVVDSSHLRQTLGWTPPFSLDEGLAQTAAQRGA
jgi:nucleoside-diphosphate-sugar epimerase